MKRIAYIAVVALAVVACNKEEGGAKIDSIKVVPETKTLYTDEALPELAVVLEPEDADVTVEWTSSDPEIVTVSDKGELAFAVKDIEDAEKTVTITAKAGEQTANCVLTVKGQISRYEVLDFTADFGFKMLDRNVGAKTKDEVGNYYQWGKNTPVAANDEAEVNANYNAEWGTASEGFADWTVAENTPCPKGWSLPAGNVLTKMNEYIEIIGTYEMEWALDLDFTYTKAEYQAAKDKIATLGLIETGKFANYTNKDKESVFGKTTLTAPAFWVGEKTVDAEKGTTTVSYYEDNSFPTIAKGGVFTTAIPVRCVKSTVAPIE